MQIAIKTVKITIWSHDAVKKPNGTVLSPMIDFFILNSSKFLCIFLAAKVTDDEFRQCEYQIYKKKEWFKGCYSSLYKLTGTASTDEKCR